MPVDTPTLSPFPILPLACSLAENRIGARGASALAAILKETKITSLKCAATPKRFAFLSTPPDTPSHHTHTVTRSLHNNGFDDTTKTSLKEATSAKNGFELIL